MPCFVCCCWIPEESRVYTADETTGDDGLNVYILRSLDGAERFRVATLDVETVSSTLVVDNYRVLVTGRVVQIRAKLLRWRLHKEDCIFTKASANPENVNESWYFICEKCIFISNLKYKGCRVKAAVV